MRRNAKGERQPVHPDHSPQRVDVEEVVLELNQFFSTG
jgi:hypothetical protein